jgi:hypothetical protein
MNKSTHGTEDQIRSMLTTFAGPPTPVPRSSRRTRRATGRTLVLVAFAAAVLVVGVPGGLALLSSLWETPKQFVADHSQPAQARRLIEHAVRGKHIEIETLIVAPTPNGKVYIYLLHFGAGRTGYFFIGPKHELGPGVSGTIVGNTANGLTGLTPPCPPGWALQYVDGGDSLPRYRSDGYVFGRAAPRVASIHVLYPDGSTTPGTVDNGFFFTSIKSSAANSNVTLIANNNTGKTVARLLVGGYGGSPFPTNKPWPLFICAA